MFGGINSSPVVQIYFTVFLGFAQRIYINRYSCGHKKRHHPVPQWGFVLRSVSGKADRHVTPPGWNEHCDHWNCIMQYAPENDVFKYVNSCITHLNGA